jgi:hypothetical protein
MTNRAEDPEKALQKAYQEALAFLPSRANALAITPVQASEYAEQEAVFHTIAIDENGMTSGMRLNVLQPVQAGPLEQLRDRGSAQNGGYQRSPEAPCRGGGGTTEEG